MGNTVGSLSEVQQSIIIGTLFGDGSMRCKANALLEVNHCFHQKNYVDWKYRHLMEFVRTPPSRREGNGGRVAYRFVTRALPELTPYYRLFYAGGRKTIPNVTLTPLALAVWFMDDGCKSRSAVYLNTQQFGEDSQRELLQMLSSQCDIRATLNRDKIYQRIRISVGSMPRFRELVEPYLLDDFKYKLPQVTP